MFKNATIYVRKPDIALIEICKADYHKAIKVCF